MLPLVGVPYFAILCDQIVGDQEFFGVSASMC